MTWIATFATGLLSAVCGAFVVACLGGLCANWYRISSFEGGSGYFVVGLGLLGAISGFIVGVICSRLVVEGAEAHFLKGLGIALGTVCAVTLVAGVLAYLAADHPPKIDGRSLELEVELRTPREYPRLSKQEEFTPSVGILRHGNNKSGGSGRFDLDKSRQEDGSWIVPATCSLITSYPQKMIWVSLEKQTSLYFDIRLAGHPTKADMNWTEWYDVSSIYKDSVWSKEAGKTGFKVRYRVRLEELPPPGRSAEEIATEKATRDQAEFEQLNADAPIRSWLRYTRGTPPERLKTALTNISSRANFAMELDGLMRDEDPEVASEALRVVAQLTEPSAALNGPVKNAGRHLGARLERVVARTADEDPALAGAAEISVRFSGWMEAARTLREKWGGDFSAELRTILQLARQRPDSYVLRNDVVRVASYHLQQWTGEAPLPTDPPPR
jgi:hypothetical protein